MVPRAISKLVISWMVGERSGKTAKAFLDDVAGRLANRVQVTTDGHKMHLNAVPDAFPQGVDYAQVVKIYGFPNDGETRYSPPQCIGCESHTVTGHPDPNHISTPYIERQNVTTPCVFNRSALYALQLLPDSPDASGHSRDGGWDD